MQEKKFDQITATVGLSVAAILDCPPLAMVKKQLSEEDQPALEAFLAIQLQNLSEAVNISTKLNLQAHQMTALACQLIELYPTESLEDFVLCFKKGALGFYGTIYKLDASVICTWMAAYLDEKYSLIEGQVANAQVQTNEENEVNYEAFKERAPELFKKETHVNDFRENDYQKWALENPRKYFNVEGLEVYATSQLHAQQIVEQMIKSGELIRVEEEKK